MILSDMASTHLVISGKAPNHAHRVTILDPSPLKNSMIVFINFLASAALHFSLVLKSWQAHSVIQSGFLYFVENFWHSDQVCLMSILLTLAYAITSVASLP
jgi:hypothetical protein